MNPLLYLSIIFFIFVSQVSAQDKRDAVPSANADLPYARIPDSPAFYSAGKVAARVIDGLGFRYYWATEGLTEADLTFKPSEGARTTEETIYHIYGLSTVIVNAMLKKANIRESTADPLTFEEIRIKTLDNLRTASDILGIATDEDVGNFKIKSGGGENASEFPFWNLLNGPIADAIYHTGQVVSFRRSSGNPINPKVRVFTGSVSE